jgi:hypothetical protein
MIYLIFTEAGFEEAKESILQDKATLWINDGILSKTQQALLSKNEIAVTVLKSSVNPSNEKDIMAAIESIEIEYPDTEILVEYL